MKRLGGCHTDWIAMVQGGSDAERTRASLTITGAFDQPGSEERKRG